MYFVSRKKSKTRKIIIAVALLLLTAIFAMFYLFGSANKQNIKVPKLNNIIKTNDANISKLNISFIGDLIMHTAERKSGYNEENGTYDFNYFFKDIKSYFVQKDYVIGNFETPVSKEKSDKMYAGYPSFRNPPEFIEAIKNAGVNVFVTSNNHVLDQGSKGVVETMNWIEKYGIPYTGTFKTQEDRQSKPVLFLEKNNIKVALVNYTEITNAASPNSYMVNYINYEKIKKDIDFAKANKADTTIVWLHFGSEYHRLPTDSQRKIVENVAKLGADVIIGSHPHVIEPMEVLTVDGRKVFVIYSIGNFISNQYWRYSTDGLILNMELEKKNGKTKFENINYIPTAVIREYNGPQTQNEVAIKQNDKSSDFITGAISKGVLKGNEVKFRVVAVGQAIYDYQNKMDKNLTNNDYIRLKTTWDDTTGLMGESQDFKVYRDTKTQNLSLGNKVIE